MLADLQEEQDKEVTGEFLEPFTKATIADAAREAAMVARREYYFRPHGPVAAHWLEWAVENALIDEHSEKRLNQMPSLDQSDSVARKHYPENLDRDSPTYST